MAGASKADLDKLLASIEKRENQGATLANVRLQGRKLKNLRLWEVTFSRAHLSDCTLYGYGFRDTCFDGACLDEVKAEGQHLRHCSSVKATLKKARFRAMGMHDPDFSGADLSGASFNDVSLYDAIFKGAMLAGTLFKEVKLYGADLSKTRIDGAKFPGARYDKKTRWPGEPPKEATFDKKPEM